MSGPQGHVYSGQSRFAIASRLGGFRSTVTLPDPFGTTATFTIHRKGSQAHAAWAKSRIDDDPIANAYASQLYLGDDVQVLTADEAKVVESARELHDFGTVLPSLLAIIDRLTDSTLESNRGKEAVRRALSSGRVKLSDLVTERQTRQINEALFLLAGWANMPDADGAEIPFSVDAARDLLLCDVPVIGVGIDDLLMSQKCWTLEIGSGNASEGVAGAEDEQTEDPVDSADTINGKSSEPIPDPETITIINPTIHTVGQAYILWLNWVSESSGLFRNQTMEEAAKNSAAPSDLSI